MWEESKDVLWIVGPAFSSRLSEVCGWASDVDGAVGRVFDWLAVRSIVFMGARRTSPSGFVGWCPGVQDPIMVSLGAPGIDGLSLLAEHTHAWDVQQYRFPNTDRSIWWVLYRTMLHVSEEIHTYACTQIQISTNTHTYSLPLMLIHIHNTTIIKKIK